MVEILIERQLAKKRENGKQENARGGREMKMLCENNYLEYNSVYCVHCACGWRCQFGQYFNCSC